jgi:radical SAM superfamily enzyme YgiQ (UPF0313 family)
MKIGFIEPWYSRRPSASNSHFKALIRKKDIPLPLWNNPNLALLTLAGLIPEDWEIKFIHCPLEDIDYDLDLDIIAITGVTYQAEAMKRIAEGFRQRSVYTIVGGPHASVCPEDVKKYSDSVFIGEAEETFVEFVEDFVRGEPKPFYECNRRPDLKKSPLPRFEILDRTYVNYPIQTSRGCPHGCRFCTIERLYGRKQRHKTAEQVGEEIKHLKLFRSNPLVLFVDNNMTVDRAYFRKILEVIRPLDIHWQAQTDVSVGLDKELLQFMYEAGCKELFIGFESLNPENILQVNSSHWKADRIPEYEEATGNIQEKGIRVFGAFILGFDDDTQEDFEEIKKFVLSHRILGQFTILTPIPGSSIYEEYKKAGKLLNRPWEFYNFLDCVIKHPRFSPDDLEKVSAELYEMTYSPEHYSSVMSRMLRMTRRMEKKSARAQYFF